MKPTEITSFQNFLTVLDIQDSFRELFEKFHTKVCYHFPVRDYDEFIQSVSAKEVFTEGFPTGNPDMRDWQQEIHQLWIAELEKTPDQSEPSTDKKVQEKAALPEGENFLSLSSGYKFCPCCYRLKKVSEFTANANNPDGLNIYCRQCFSAKDQKKHDVEMSVHHAVYSQNRIFFSPEFAEIIKSKGLIGATITKRKGHLFLSFVKKSKTRNLKWYKRNDGFSVIDLSISKAVASFFKQTVEDAFYLHISRNTSKKDDMVTVEIIRMYTPEDMKSIKFVKRTELSSQGLVSKKEEQEEQPKQDYTFDDKREAIQKLRLKMNISDEEFADIITDDFIFFAAIPHPSNEEMEKRDKIENLLAKTLKHYGWKLQRPVRIVQYEEF